MGVIFSIIIPHKNIPELLQRMLDSIPKRDDVQVIVVDDNSDPSIVDFTHFPGLNKHNTEVYFTREGKGPGAARNFGLTKAKGDWILFADADDYYETAVLENFMNVCINEGKDYDIILIGLKIIFLDGNSKTDLYGMSLGNNICEYENILQLYKDQHQSVRKVVKRDLIYKNNIKFSEIVYCEDQSFSIDSLHVAQKIGIYPQLIYIYEKRVSSTTITMPTHVLLPAFCDTLSCDKKLLKWNLNVHMIVMGHILYYIAKNNILLYWLLFFYELLVLGKKITMADYMYTCSLRMVHPNIFRQLFDPIRVRLGYIRKYM